MIEEGFRKFLGKASPQYQWEPRHLKLARIKLNAVSSGDIKRLMVFMPPRHGKSEQNTVHYSSYRTLRDQQLKVIIGAYNHTLATEFSQACRRINHRFGYEFAKDNNKQHKWSSVHGGGVYAVGVGSGVTGFGADLVDLDDPIKGRKDAESAAWRRTTIDWYRNDIYTRLHPGAPVILTLTRWHSLDLAGQLLDEEKDGGEKWEVVVLPAIAEENDPIGRNPGEALWPERYGIEDLDRIRKTIGNYAFTALFQQAPFLRTGDFFQRHWFQPIDPDDSFDLSCRAWDVACGKRKTSDRSASVRIDRRGDIYVVKNVWADRQGHKERRKTQRHFAEMDGQQTIIRLAQDPGAAGVEQVENDIANLIGFGVEARVVSGDKETRAKPFATAAAEGKVFMERGPWNEMFLDELTSFPVGKHDDIVDAASDAFSYVVLQSPFEWYA